MDRASDMIIFLVISVLNIAVLITILAVQNDLWARVRAVTAVAQEDRPPSYEVAMRG